MIYLAGWRGKTSACVMVSKKEKISFLQKFEGVEIPKRFHKILFFFQQKFYGYYY